MQAINSHVSGVGSNPSGSPVSTDPAVLPTCLNAITLTKEGGEAMICFPSKGICYLKGIIVRPRVPGLKKFKAEEFKNYGHLITSKNKDVQLYVRLDETMINITECYLRDFDDFVPKKGENIEYF